MSLDHLFGKSQSQTSTIPFDRSRVVGPVEFLEDVRQIGVGNADSRVGNADSDERAVPFHLYGHSATFRRVLDRVGIEGQLRMALP